MFHRIGLSALPVEWRLPNKERLVREFLLNGTQYVEQTLAPRLVVFLARLLISGELEYKYSFRSPFYNDSRALSHYVSSLIICAPGKLLEITDSSSPASSGASSKDWTSKVPVSLSELVSLSLTFSDVFEEG